MVSSNLFLSESSQSYGEILGYLPRSCVVSGRGIGLEVYLDVLGAVLPVDAFWEIQAPQQAQHPGVLPHDQGEKAPDAVLAGGLDQASRQPDPEPSSLESVLDERRILGPVGVSFPLVTNDPDDLLGVLGIQSNQRIPILAVDVGEPCGHLIGELFQWSKEPQLYGPVARPPHESLQSRCILSPNPPHRYTSPIPENKTFLPVHRHKAPG